MVSLFGRQFDIKVHPEWIQPCVRGTGVLVSFVASRFAAGESVADLAVDYGVSQEAVEDAIACVVRVNGTSIYNKRAQAALSRELWRFE